MKSKNVRTSQGLRDILFNEIEELQNGTGDPRRAVAVSNLARQIIGTVRVELDFARQAAALREAGGDVALGTLKLGKSKSRVAGAVASATEH